MASKRKVEDLLAIPASLKRKPGDSTVVDEVEEPRAHDDGTPADLPEDVAFRRVYYLRGTPPKHWGVHFFVKDPPTSGWARAFVLGAEGAKRLTVFCPYTLTSAQVPADAGELRGELVALTAAELERLIGIITEKWNEYVRIGFQRDYDVAALVLTKLGAAVPKASLADASIERPPGSAPIKERKERKGGKPRSASLLKPVDRGSKRGRVAEFFLGAEHKSVRECMARLEMTRNSVLSALHVLNKDHGLGYTVLNDTASIVIPPDWDIWS